MSLNQTSLAAAVGASVNNVQFQSGVFNLPRKILIVGTYLPTMTAVVPNVPVQIYSPNDAGAQFGFRSMIHRLAIQTFLGGNGVPTFVLPMAEADGAAAATGSIDFTGSTGVLAGTVYLYIVNNLTTVNVSAGMTPTQIAAATVAAINADNTNPVSAAVNGSIPGKVDITSSSKGIWGNFISVALNLGYGQSLPGGVQATIVALSGGSGVPVVATALNALGTDDSANEAGFTDVCHGFVQDSTTLTAFSTYNGIGNDFTGCYSKVVARPFRVLTGDVAAGSTGLNNLITLTSGMMLDRTNGVIAVPGSASHPSEIAAQAIAQMAAVNQDIVAQSYVGIQLVNIDPGPKSSRWTSVYDNRDTAVKAGISPTLVQNGVVTMQNVCTFYRPSNVPVSSNGYRSMRNISIIQNMLRNIQINFQQAKWQGISIVADCRKVTSSTDRQKARDIDAVIDDLVALAKGFESHAWIYTADFSISRLKLPGAVTIRSGGTGFNNILSAIFSGEGSILDTQVQFDTALTVLTN